MLIEPFGSRRRTPFPAPFEDAFTPVDELFEEASTDPLPEAFAPLDATPAPLPVLETSGDLTRVLGGVSTGTIGVPEPAPSEPAVTQEMNPTEQTKTRKAVFMILVFSTRLHRRAALKASNFRGRDSG